MVTYSHQNYLLTKEEHTLPTRRSQKAPYARLKVFVQHIVYLSLYSELVEGVLKQAGDVGAALA